MGCHFLSGEEMTLLSSGWFSDPAGICDVAFPLHNALIHREEPGSSSKQATISRDTVVCRGYRGAFL